jgi:glycine cleavage system aminomethyltransferase T
MNSLRIEKGYRHWGHDIADEDSPLEAGLGFAVAMDKPGGFIGREALLRQKERGLTRRLAQFVMEDVEPLLYHNEPILRDDKIVGRITSGMFGHTIGRAIGLGYVENGDDAVTPEFVQSNQFEIEVAGARFRATASLKPLYDPKNLRVKGVEGRTIRRVA